MTPEEALAEIESAWLRSDDPGNARALIVLIALAQTNYSAGWKAGAERTRTDTLNEIGEHTKGDCSCDPRSARAIAHYISHLPLPTWPSDK